MRREYFTVNPAYPHPDSEPGDPPPMALWEAVAWAAKTLRDPQADQFKRNYVADQLLCAFESQDDQK